MQEKEFYHPLERAFQAFLINNIQKTDSRVDGGGGIAKQSKKIYINVKISDLGKILLTFLWYDREKI